MRLLAVVQTADEWPDDIIIRIRQTPISIYFYSQLQTRSNLRMPAMCKIPSLYILYGVQHQSPVYPCGKVDVWRAKRQYFRFWRVVDQSTCTCCTQRASNEHWCNREAISYAIHSAMSDMFLPQTCLSLQNSAPLHKRCALCFDAFRLLFRFVVVVVAYRSQLLSFSYVIHDMTNMVAYQRVAHTMPMYIKLNWRPINTHIYMYIHIIQIV